MNRKQPTDKELETEVKHFIVHEDELYAAQSARRRASLDDPAKAGFFKECRERRAIAEALHKARAEAKLTQAEVARRMCVSQPYIAKLERATGTICLNAISKYAAACGKRIHITLL